MLGMNPQQTTIDQLPDEKLATYGWNIRETQDGHRRQAEVCEQQLQAIRQEFVRRSQLRQEQEKAAEAEKKSEYDSLADQILAKLEARKALPPTNGTPEAKESKAE